MSNIIYIKDFSKKEGKKNLSDSFPGNRAVQPTDLSDIPDWNQQAIIHTLQALDEFAEENQCTIEVSAASGWPSAVFVCMGNSPLGDYSTILHFKNGLSFKGRVPKVGKLFGEKFPILQEGGRNGLKKHLRKSLDEALAEKQKCEEQFAIIQKQRKSPDKTEP